MALGAIATPFNPFEESGEPSSHPASRNKALQIAEQYYQYARRRFGLLGMGLTACQCYFLSGIYLLYTLRPIEAWHSFFQASSLFTVYLKSGSAAHVFNGVEHLDHPMVLATPCCDDEMRQGLEQRLYWGCLKCERSVTNFCMFISKPRASSMLTLIKTQRLMQRSRIAPISPTHGRLPLSVSVPPDAEECRRPRQPPRPQHSRIFFYRRVCPIRD